jgi:uncharacterized phage protein gp47/JayE
MAYTRPTLAAIIARIEADMSTRLLDGAAVLRRAFLGVLARVFAGAIHLVYGFLVWMSKQIVPGTDNDSEFLDQHADDYGVTRRAAAYATGNIDFTGSNSSVVPTGTLLQRSDGVQYATTAEGTISSGTATVAAQAVTAGNAGNCDAATALQLVSAIAGITSAAAASSGGMTGGIEQESDAELLARLQERKQNMPQGGCKLDYEIWAKEISGVYRAWCFPLYDEVADVYPAPGWVGVTFVTASGLPSGALVSEVQAYIQDTDLSGKAPVTAMVKVYAPVEETVDFHVHLSPNTTAIQAAVQAAIVALFDREAAPNVTIPLSHIDEAIQSTAGVTDHLLVTPASAVVSTRKQMPTTGSFTWGSL